MTIHYHDGTLNGKVKLPVSFTRYIRAEDADGERYLAVQAKGGLGCQVYQYEPETRTWVKILAPGQFLAWELLVFRLLPDGRLIFEAKPSDDDTYANQWLIHNKA